jgi:hypothetical protein
MGNAGKGRQAQMTATTAPVTPWYRQAWPWFLISLPAAAVIAGSITFYLAASGWDGPVAQDYYKQGLAINEELTRSKLARDLGVTATVRLAGISVGERVRVELQSGQPMPPEAALRLRLVHPGRPEADRQAVLARIDAAADGRTAVYVGDWQQGEADARIAAQPVAWQVVLETQQWRIDDGFSAGGAGEFTLRAR